MGVKRGLGSALTDKRRSSTAAFPAGFEPASHDHSQDRTMLDQLDDGNDPLVLISGRRYDPPNALKVMMVRVSCTPATVCTFWAMKWPMSVDCST
jgi:hypothetical protein